MTRSPLLSTFFSILPLVALAVPLSKVLSPEPVIQTEIKETAKESDLVRSDLLLRSAHPFERVVVNDVIFEKGEVKKEIFLNLEEPLTVEVTWPEGTPESALLLELLPDALEMKSHTLWGSGSAFEEITFHWEDAE
ncbi:hypothetical protein N9F44_02140 [Akkermansiaceae bacterium]|nr:hypothetical protein [Akkermansiaceae bacterium]